MFALSSIFAPSNLSSRYYQTKHQLHNWFGDHGASADVIFQNCTMHAGWLYTTHPKQFNIHPLCIQPACIDSQSHFQAILMINPKTSQVNCFRQRRCIQHFIFISRFKMILSKRKVLYVANLYWKLFADVSASII